MVNQKSAGFCAAIVAAFGLAAAVQADVVSSIGISLGSDTNGQTMASTETAGVIPQANWNQAPFSGSTSGDNSSNTAMNISGPVAGSIVDESGSVVSGITVAWKGAKGNQTWNAGNSFVNTGDNDMMKGYLDSGYNGTYATDNEYVSFSNIPSAYTSGGYDIYVYIAGTNSAQTVQLDPSSSTSTPLIAFSSMNNPSSYIEATAPGGAADYVEFPDQTASSFTVTDWSPGISGVQIVADSASVPEPASLGLLGFGAAALLIRRRRSV
jgi:hypothetical protein